MRERKERMTIYVDEVRTYSKDSIKGRAKRWGTRWCHMWASTPQQLEELHEMARRIGLRRNYFQNRAGFPHYDMVPSKRALAMMNGAEFMPLRDWIKRNRE